MTRSKYSTVTYHGLEQHQPLDVMQEWMSPEEYRGFLRGNVIKYIARYQRKGGVRDLAKMLDYGERLIILEAQREADEQAQST